MSSETSVAFESPLLRAALGEDDNPLDRISVRDYLLDVEIGAFQAERGVTQRIRVNVVLEVSRHAAAQSDDVDRVLSYDSITEAIDAQLSTERINLLETFAERIAERVLDNAKAVRAFVRVEKLDRIPGALGVEIVRNKVAGENVVRPVAAAETMVIEDIKPLVVFLQNDVLHGKNLTGWLDAIAGHDLPAIICVDCATTEKPAADIAAANRRIELLSIEQNAWVLAGKDKRCVVVDSRTEIDWALKHHRLVVWAPSKLVLDAVEGLVRPDADALHLALWLSGEFAANSLYVAGGAIPGDSHPALRFVDDPKKL